MIREITIDIVDRSAVDIDDFHLGSQYEVAIRGVVDSVEPWNEDPSCFWHEVDVELATIDGVIVADEGFAFVVLDGSLPEGSTIDVMTVTARLSNVNDDGVSIEVVFTES